MTQLLLTDAIQRGHSQAEACTEATRREARNDWPELALAALRKFCWQRKAMGRDALFTSEECVQYCYEHDLIKAHCDKAWGHIYLKAARNGWIAQTDQIYRRVNGNGSIALKWRVL